MEMMKYVRGASNDISPGTLGEGCAEHAKALIARHLELAIPEHKVALLQAGTKSCGLAPGVRGVALDAETVAGGRAASPDGGPTQGAVSGARRRSTLNSR